MRSTSVDRAIKRTQTFGTFISPISTSKMTEYRSYHPSDASELEALFVSVFTKSEGETEGAMVGGLAKEMLAETDPLDLHGFVAVEGKQIVGAILFSRLTFEQDVEAFILSPVAVASDQQGRGVGQELIKFGLQELKQRGVQIVTTYGDPAYYCKVGFEPLSPELIRPPFELSQPEGWIGQSLAGDPIKPISGRCSCVKALSNPVYW